MKTFVLRTIVTCAAALAVTTTFAAEYPTKPIRLLVGFAAGGSAEIIARAAGQKAAETLKQSVVIDIRAGAAGIIATDLAAKAEPDGYTLLEATMTTHGIGPHLYKKLPYDAVNDFVPVAGLARIPLVMFAHASVPAATLAEFIAAAKTSPPKFSFGSAGPGSPPHLAAELLRIKTGVQILHVPYKGTGAALPELVGGQIHVMIDGPPPFLAHVKSGKLRALAAASEKRNPLLPNVPTFAEAGVSGMESGLWYGVLAPKRTPKHVIARLNTEFNRALGAADIRERFAAMGAEAIVVSPEGFARFMREEYKRWGDVIKAANIKIE